MSILKSYKVFFFLLGKKNPQIPSVNLYWYQEFFDLMYVKFYEKNMEM